MGSFPGPVKCFANLKPPRFWAAEAPFHFTVGSSQLIQTDSPRCQSSTSHWRRERGFLSSPVRGADEVSGHNYEPTDVCQCASMLETLTKAWNICLLSEDDLRLDSWRQKLLPGFLCSSFILLMLTHMAISSLAIFHLFKIPIVPLSSVYPRNDLNREQQQPKKGVCVGGAGEGAGQREEALFHGSPNLSPNTKVQLEWCMYVFKHETQVGLEEFLGFNLVVVNYLPLTLSRGEFMVIWVR